MHVINNHRWFWTVLLAGLALATIPVTLVSRYSRITTLLSEGSDQAQFDYVTAHVISMHGLPFLGCMGKDGNWAMFHKCVETHTESYLAD